MIGGPKSATALFLLLGGCMTAPEHAPLAPPAAATGAFFGAASGTSLAPVPSHWWRLFEDPVLDAHVERALGANADLRVALANLQVARASVDQARVARLPQTLVESGAGPDRADRQPSTSTIPKTSYDLGATLSYEVDLFGRLSSAANAARADADASAAAADTARVMVAADTVAAYVDLCGANVGASLARERIASQRRGADLVDRQFREGEVSPLEVAQAKAVLRRAEADLPPFEALRRDALFRLATLQGRPPADADALDNGCATMPKIAMPLPVGDGAALLARRPDIREAERRLAAATARIGVVRAELYPRVQLGGSAGLIGGGFDAILTPLISWAFPNQGAARARIASARGVAAAALANWDVVVLRSLRETEVALANYRAENERYGALAAALVDADKAMVRARARFRLGADSYILVIDAERTRNDTAAQLAVSRLRLAQIQVALFRALGGGWQSDPTTATGQ